MIVAYPFLTCGCCWGYFYGYSHGNWNPNKLGFNPYNIYIYIYIILYYTILYIILYYILYIILYIILYYIILYINLYYIIIYYIIYIYTISPATNIHAWNCTSKLSRLAVSPRSALRVGQVGYLVIDTPISSW